MATSHSINFIGFIGHYQLFSLRNIEVGTFIGPDGNTVEATTLPNAPELSYSIGLNYAIELSNGALISTSANYAYTDKYSTQTAPDEFDYVDARGLLNLRLDYIFDEAWTASLMCNNCTDKSFGYGGRDLRSFWDNVVSYRGAPRTLSAQLKYEFQIHQYTVFKTYFG